MTIHSPSGLVSAPQSTDNVTGLDVIGNKQDRTYLGGDSTFAHVHSLEDHAHQRQYVLPDRASPITATAGTGWAYGAASASLGTPGGYFDIHWVDILSGNNAEYQGLILVNGVEACEFSWEQVAAVDRTYSQAVQMAIFAAGPITIKIASSSNGATATFKVAYHLY